MTATTAEAPFAGTAAPWANWRVNPTQIATWTILFLGGVVMVLPFVFMVSTSFKFNNEIYELSLLPREPTIENYLFLFAETNFGRWFFNSLLIATATTVSVLFFDSLVGYTLCKFRFRGRSVVFVLILSTLMIPTEMLVIPWYIMSRDFGWLNSYWDIMFPGLMTDFGTFLMKQFFETIPDDFLDAARIDGLNEFQIWWEIATPLIVTNSAELFTIPVGFASFSGEFTTDWELIMTGATLASLPTLLVFIVFQKFIIRGVMLAGLKG